MYSEKTTTFCEVSIVDLSLCSNKVEISQNFVAFEFEWALAEIRLQSDMVPNIVSQMKITQQDFKQAL